MAGKKKMDDILASFSSLDGDAEFIPILGKEEEESLQQSKMPDTLPVLPIRNNVLFPGMVMPIILTREKAVPLVKDASRAKKPIGVLTQSVDNQDEPKVEDLYAVGTMAHVLKTLKMPDGSMMAVIQGLRRFKLGDVVAEEPYLQAKAEAYDDVRTKGREAAASRKAMLGAVRELYSKVVKLSGKMPQETLFAVQNIESADFLIYYIAGSLEMEVSEKQELLEMTRLEDRAMAVMAFLNRDKQMLELKRKIENKVEADISKQQKEYFLTQQLKTIQEELGGSGEQEVRELEEKARAKHWNQEVQEHFNKEIKKLQRTHSMSPEYSIQFNYLNTLVDLPWNEYTTDKYDLEKAKKVLDKDHFGLEKVKDRILSYLAVLKLRGDMKAPILCLVGPPGVGKTSLGRSIAEAMGRKYVRISLGGLHDEGEVRGHRKTYIGAMPGRIIQGIKKAGSSNPVFMLDEIDKVSGATVNGDPSAALLEILDPEQNNAFHDNYLEVDYDLSHVLFIATANSLSGIHPALIDRMEIIEVPSYVQAEKVEIASRHLLPRQLKEHGLKARDLSFPKDQLYYLIGEYTREAGVRQLEKRIAGIVRERAKCMVSEDAGIQHKGKRLTRAFIREALGVPPFSEPERLRKDTVGVVTGLAWTQAGGDVLFIETALSSGKGELGVTGNLGNVMQESATLALAYIKSHASALGIKEEMLENSRIHMHVPEGATPKDGPSAGLAIFTAMVSVLKGQAVRCGLAMTGEISLRGQVLPIGGVREKILAAKRAGISQVVLPKENRPQVEDIPALYTEGLQIAYVDRIEDILPLALCGETDKKAEV